MGGSLDPHPSVNPPPPPQTSLLGSQGAEGKEEERANGKGRREQTESIGVGREVEGEGGWQGDWEVEPRASPPDLGGTLGC